MSTTKKTTKNQTIANTPVEDQAERKQFDETIANLQAAVESIAAQLKELKQNQDSILAIVNENKQEISDIKSLTSSQIETYSKDYVGLTNKIESLSLTLTSVPATRKAAAPRTTKAAAEPGASTPTIRFKDRKTWFVNEYKDNSVREKYLKIAGNLISANSITAYKPKKGGLSQEEHDRREYAIAIYNLSREKDTHHELHRIFEEDYARAKENSSKGSAIQTLKPENSESEEDH